MSHIQELHNDPVADTTSSSRGNDEEADDIVRVTQALRQDLTPNKVVSVESLLSSLDSGAIQLADGVPMLLIALASQVKTGTEIDIDYVADCQRYSRQWVQKKPGGIKALVCLKEASRISFIETGDIDDLNEIILAGEKILSNPSVLPLVRLIILQTLAKDLFERFQLERRSSDLENARQHLTDALAIKPLSTRREATILHNLGFVHSTLFAILGRIRDLESAIKYQNKALNLQPDQNRSMVLHSLANDYLSSFREMERRSDLDHAIRLHQDALADHDDHIYPRYFFLSSLGRALTIRCRNNLSEDWEKDIDEAISYHQDALASFRERSAAPEPFAASRSSAESRGIDALGIDEDHAICLNAYIHSMWTRFETLRSNSRSYAKEELDRAIECGKMAAEELLPAGHPVLANVWKNLARLHLCLPEPDCAQANHYFSRAAGLETANMRVRFTGAAEWAACARRHNFIDADIKIAYDKAMHLLSHCMITYLTVDSQHEFLTRPLTQSTYSSLTADAASFAIKQGNFNRAVEILEQGRTFLWSRLRGYRQELSALHDSDPEIAEKFSHLSTDLEHFSVFFESASGSLTSSELISAGLARKPSANLHMLQSIGAEWNTVLKHIREKTIGFRDFLKPLLFNRLRPAAAEGPIILLNYSAYSSDALIIHPRKSGSQPITRVELDSSELGNLAEDLKSTLCGSYYLQSESATRSSQIRREEGPKSGSLLEELRRIWTTIVQRIVPDLEARKYKRIWWCPTGRLAALPLHAAGPYEDGQQNPLDSYISSYTPTLQALIAAREGIASSTSPALLVVGVDNAPDLPKLHMVREECATAYNLIQGSSKSLMDSEANRDAVLKHLPNFPWVHLTCHALHDPLEPFDSAFMLVDKGLTLRDFMAAHHPNAGLAILSSCSSAAIDVEGRSLPNEVLHLAAAVQFCGFRSVVATLWSMGDVTGPILAREFYNFLLRSGIENVDLKDSAEALSNATKKMREEYPQNPELWASFVHIGI